MASFYALVSTALRLQSPASRLQSHCKEAGYFLPLISQKFLVFIWLTLEGWKAESTLEPPKGFENGTSGFGIQRFNQQAIAPWKLSKLD